MKLALQLPVFTLPGGPQQIADRLSRVARIADAAGFQSIWVMDHFFQIPGVGDAEEPMLEGYTTLAFLAAHTTRARLGTLVTGVTYRQPAILVKEVTTLDVLSGGRAYLGIGAAWFEREHKGLGVPFPPLKTRFEELEETLQIALQMWDQSNDGPYQGKHFQLAETLCHPPVLTAPHPPILIGGGGEQKTLRMVARYADACNFFSMMGDDVLRHKLDVLRQHCANLGRSFDSIEKTVGLRLDPKEARGQTGAVLEQMKGLSDMGFQTAILSLTNLDAVDAFEAVCNELAPRAASI